jgi:hypothetical protein
MHSVKHMDGKSWYGILRVLLFYNVVLQSQKGVMLLNNQKTLRLLAIVQASPVDLFVMLLLQFVHSNMKQYQHRKYQSL